MDTLKANKSLKFYKKSCESMDPKTQHENITIQDPPRPQKTWFYYSKTHVFKDPPYPLKVTKMTPKCSPNGSKIDPMAPMGPPIASKKTRRERTKKKTSKALKRKIRKPPTKENLTHPLPQTPSL